MQAGPHDEPLLSFRIHHAMDCGHLPARGPALGRRQTLAPGLAAIHASLVNDASLAVALRVNDQNGLAVLE